MMVAKHKLPEILTEWEQEKLLKQPNLRYPTSYRNYAMIKLMLDTGLKLSEATGLYWDDIDFAENEITITESKIVKDRTLPLKDNMIETLRGWEDRQIREVRFRRCSYVFTTLKGKPLNNRYVRKMIKRYTKKADIDKNINPNSLRHTFALKLYEETEDIKAVQKALGHKDLNSTKIYYYLANKEIYWNFGVDLKNHMSIKNPVDTFFTTRY